MVLATSFRIPSDPNCIIRERGQFDQGHKSQFGSGQTALAPPSCAWSMHGRCPVPPRQRSGRRARTVGQHLQPQRSRHGRRRTCPPRCRTQTYLRPLACSLKPRPASSTRPSGSGRSRTRAEPLMSASRIAPALPPRASGEIRPCADATYADLHVSTMDGQGCPALRGPALAMGWAPGQDLALTVRDGILRLSSPIHSTQTRCGVTVVLDSRWRVLLPYGIRVHSGWELGIRLMVLAIPIEGVAAAVPVSRVVSAFLGGS